MFAIPWHNHVIVGTTDTPIEEATLDPMPFDHEIEFILETAGAYLSSPPKRSDVLSVFVGIRPLVKSGAGSTAALSRDHVIHIDGSGLLTICGGKWTTYRKMAEDCVDHAVMLTKLPEKNCITKNLRIHGYHENREVLGDLSFYGSDALIIQELIYNDSTLGEKLLPALPYLQAEVVFAARTEMARTVDDFLSRRVRALFLNAQASIAMAPKVAQLMAKELNLDAGWVNDQLAVFKKLASQYVLADNYVKK
jgi:glycerol-3-phosphate dehydrogenase